MHAIGGQLPLAWFTPKVMAGPQTTQGDIRLANRSQALAGRSGPAAGSLGARRSRDEVVEGWSGTMLAIGVPGEKGTE